jgi:hypothetical protein
MFTIHQLADLLISQLGFKRIDAHAFNSENPQSIESYIDAYELLDIGDGYQMNITPFSGKVSNPPKNIYKVACNDQIARIRAIKMSASKFEFEAAKTTLKFFGASAAQKYVNIFKNNPLYKSTAYDSEKYSIGIDNLKGYLFVEHDQETPRSLAQAALNILGNTWLNQNNEIVMRKLAKILSKLPEPTYKGILKDIEIEIKQAFGCYYLMYDDFMIDTSDLCNVKKDDSYQPNHLMTIRKIVNPQAPGGI